MGATHAGHRTRQLFDRIGWVLLGLTAGSFLVLRAYGAAVTIEHFRLACNTLLGLFGVGNLFRLAAFGPADRDEQRDRVKLAGVSAGCVILGIGCAITNFSASIVLQGLALAVMFWTRRVG